MAVRVISGGLLTTVQDAGRWGYQSRGVAVGGPMDPFAHRRANALVGNTADCATLEATLVGPELEFEDERLVAVTGARVPVTIDGRPAGDDGFLVRAGARLAIGRATRGARAYIAVEGGIDTTPVLGSRATHLTSGMGGLDGRALRAGDRLPLGASRPVHGARRRREHGARGRDDSSAERAIPHRHATVRVLQGPQADRFSREALNALVSRPYAIASSSNRMGFRLQGAPLLDAAGADRAANIISDATPLGSVQVPASGQPILLMADRQTTGGYAKIAVVITADVGLAGQLAPGDTIAFAWCTPREALAALIARERELMGLEQ